MLRTSAPTSSYPGLLRCNLVHNCMPLPKFLRTWLYKHYSSDPSQIRIPRNWSRDKASQRELLPLDCGVHEKSTRACPMMSMLPTTLFFEFTSWRHFLCWEVLSSREHSFHAKHEERLRKCPKTLKRTYKIKAQSSQHEVPPPKRPHQIEPPGPCPENPVSHRKVLTI